MPRRGFSFQNFFTGENTCVISSSLSPSYCCPVRRKPVSTASGSTTSQTIVKPKSKLKLPNPNLAKVKQLDAQMKALKPKLESINGLPADQQYKIDQMHDLLMKMIAVMNSLVNKMEEQSAQ